MDAPKGKKPFITIKEAIVAVAIILLTGIAFERIELNPSQIPTRSVLLAEINQFNKQIQVLPVSQIATKIDSGNGKPTILFLYASWCGYCKQVLPNLAVFKQEGRLENFNLLFISLDEDKSALSKYILEHNYDKIFSAYMLEENSLIGIDNMLITKGTNYNGSIPFTAIFNKDGKLVSTIRGITNKIYFRDLLEEAFIRSQEIL